MLPWYIREDRKPTVGKLFGISDKEVCVFDFNKQTDMASEVRLFSIKTKKFIQFDPNVVDYHFHNMCNKDEICIAKYIYNQLNDTAKLDSTNIIRYRSPNCYCCKGSLNSIIDPTCDKCGWLKCSYGACGCEYEQWKNNH